jgi:hypothetical protein
MIFCLVLCGHRGQAYFQAYPVWIYTQGNITNISQYIKKNYTNTSTIYKIRSDQKY